jgi:hypothetical protein
MFVHCDFFIGSKQTFMKDFYLMICRMKSTKNEIIDLIH